MGIIRTVLLVLSVGLCGCNKAPDPIVATFENARPSRLVFYASGKFEHYTADVRTDKLDQAPFVHGTYTSSASNYVVKIKKEDLPHPDYFSSREYRILVHEGVEYLFDERGNSRKKFEESKNPNELRHGYRRLGI